MFPYFSIHTKSSIDIHLWDGVFSKFDIHTKSPMELYIIYILLGVYDVFS